MALGVRLSRANPQRLAWPALAALLAAASLAVAALTRLDTLPWADALAWRPERALIEPWRAFTAALLHLSALHLLANLAGCALVGALGVAAGCGGRAALAWALAWPATQFALLLQPSLERYAGLSGVLHAGVATIVVRLLRGGTATERRIGAMLALGLIVKLLLEAPWDGPLRQVAGWDIAIAPAAHWAGAVCGAACALALGVGTGAAQRTLAQR